MLGNLTILVVFKNAFICSKKKKTASIIYKWCLFVIDKKLNVSLVANKVYKWVFHYHYWLWKSGIHCYVTSYEVVGFQFEKQGYQPFLANYANQRNYEAKRRHLKRKGKWGKKVKANNNLNIIICSSRATTSSNPLKVQFVYLN